MSKWRSPSDQHPVAPMCRVITQDQTRNSRQTAAPGPALHRHQESQCYTDLQTGFLRTFACANFHVHSAAGLLAVSIESVVHYPRHPHRPRPAARLGALRL